MNHKSYEEIQEQGWYNIIWGCALPEKNSRHSPPTDGVRGPDFLLVGYLLQLNLKASLEPVIEDELYLCPSVGEGEQ